MVGVKAYKGRTGDSLENYQQRSKLAANRQIQINGGVVEQKGGNVVTARGPSFGNNTASQVAANKQAMEANKLNMQLENENAGKNKDGSIGGGRRRTKRRRGRRRIKKRTKKRRRRRRSRKKRRRYKKKKKAMALKIQHKT